MSDTLQPIDPAGRTLVRMHATIYVYAWRLGEAVERVERKLMSSNSTEDENPLRLETIEAWRKV